MTQNQTNTKEIAKQELLASIEKFEKLLKELEETENLPTKEEWEKLPVIKKNLTKPKEKRQEELLREIEDMSNKILNQFETRTYNLTPFYIVSQIDINKQGNQNQRDTEREITQYLNQDFKNIDNHLLKNVFSPKTEKALILAINNLKEELQELLEKIPKDDKIKTFWANVLKFIDQTTAAEVVLPKLVEHQNVGKTIEAIEDTSLKNQLKTIAQIQTSPILFSEKSILLFNSYISKKITDLVLALLEDEENLSQEFIKFRKEIEPEISKSIKLTPMQEIIAFKIYQTIENALKQDKKQVMIYNTSEVGTGKTYTIGVMSSLIEKEYFNKYKKESVFIIVTEPILKETTIESISKVISKDEIKEYDKNMKKLTHKFVIIPRTQLNKNFAKLFSRTVKASDKIVHLIIDESSFLKNSSQSTDTIKTFFTELSKTKTLGTTLLLSATPISNDTSDFPMQVLIGEGSTKQFLNYLTSLAENGYFTTNEVEEMKNELINKLKTLCEADSSRVRTLKEIETLAEKMKEIKLEHITAEARHMLYAVFFSIVSKYIEKLEKNKTKNVSFKDEEELSNFERTIAKEEAFKELSKNNEVEIVDIRSLNQQQQKSKAVQIRELLSNAGIPFRTKNKLTEEKAFEEKGTKDKNYIIAHLKTFLASSQNIFGIQRTMLKINNSEAEFQPVQISNIILRTNIVEAIIAKNLIETTHLTSSYKKLIQFLETLTNNYFPTNYAEIQDITKEIITNLISKAKNSYEEITGEIKEKGIIKTLKDNLSILSEIEEIEEDDSETITAEEKVKRAKKQKRDIPKEIKLILSVFEDDQKMLENAILQELEARKSKKSTPFITFEITESDMIKDFIRAISTDIDTPELKNFSFKTRENEFAVYTNLFTITETLNLKLPAVIQKAIMKEIQKTLNIDEKTALEYIKISQTTQNLIKYIIENEQLPTFIATNYIETVEKYKNNEKVMTLTSKTSEKQKNEYIQRANQISNEKHIMATAQLLQRGINLLMIPYGIVPFKPRNGEFYEQVAGRLRSLFKQHLEMLSKLNTPKAKILKLNRKYFDILHNEMLVGLPETQETKRFIVEAIKYFSSCKTDNKEIEYILKDINKNMEFKIGKVLEACQEIISRELDEIENYSSYEEYIKDITEENYQRLTINKVKSLVS
jgi:hypothetical protein